MCGLVGMAGDLCHRHRNVMKTMLFFNTLRGKDSTGVSAYNATANKIETRKLTMPGYEFVQQAWIDNLLSPVRGVWIGHGRAATIGGVSRLNAHPFTVHDAEDYIVLFGAHNGTLSTKWECENKLNDKFGTDSEALLNLIYKEGVEEALKINRGAWALTWCDPAANTIHLLRNKERPLCYAYTDDMKVVLWASEPWMIRIACLREDVKLAKNEKDEEIVYGMPEDTMFTFQLPEKFNTAFEAPQRKGGLLGAPEKKTFWQGQYQGGRIDNDIAYGDGDDDILGQYWGRRTDEQKAEEKGGKGGKAGEDQTGKEDLLTGFEGQQVHRSYINELKRQGCDWCGDPIAPTENMFGWLSEMDIVCKKCLRGEHFKIDVEKGAIIDRVLRLIGGKES